MINALFVVWRECFEAVLIVGIIYLYLRREDPSSRARAFMWGGVAGGLALSALIAWAMMAAQTELEGMALEHFNSALLIVAALLMTQMCLWMKEHSRTIKLELETGVGRALSSAHLLGVASIAAIAIAREGFELVMFFLGMTVEASENGRMAELLAWSAAGVGLTALTAWAYYRGLKLFNPKRFFQVTSLFLLVTASSLVIAGVHRLVQNEVLPSGKYPLWDTSAFLDERSSFGSVVALVTGYQSTPSQTLVIVTAVYWIVTLALYFRPRRSASRPELARAAG